MSLHYNHGNDYGKEIFKFKDDSKMWIFPTQFCLESMSYKFDAVDREVSLKGNVNDFSVDYNAIYKLDTLNIHS